MDAYLNAACDFNFRREHEKMADLRLERMRETGGPAFPCEEPFCDGATVAYSGMSRRDYFAGQALAGLLADGSVPYESKNAKKSVAIDCYGLADAMLGVSGDNR